MIAVLLPTAANISAWVTDNRENIVVNQRVKNQFTLKDGKVYRLFAVRGTIDIERLRGYEWEKIIIQWGDPRWRSNVEHYVRDLLPTHSRQELEFVK